LSGEPSEFDLNAAWVRKAQADLHAFLEGLASRIGEALPDRVTIERQRDGLFSSTRHVSKIAVAFDTEVLSLERVGRDVVAQRSKVVRGVRIRSEQVSVADWLVDLDNHLRRLAGGVQSVAGALHEFLMS